MCAAPQAIRVGPGIVPRGLSGMFRDVHWTASRRWTAAVQIGIINGITAAISVSGAAIGDTQMTEIDLKIDDGDLSTGLLI